MVVVGATQGRSGGVVGGGGGGGGGGAGAVDEGKVCSVAWQRQHVHLQQHHTKTGIKMAAQGGDTLPVVELRPFTRKVWRREKSLPNFYDRPLPLKDDSAAESSRPARNGPPPDIMRYIRELSDQQKTVDSKQSADSTLRYRSKLHPHPKTDFSFEGWSVADHQQDIIPSFISRQDRTKTTLVDEGAAPGTSATTAGAGSSGGGTGNISDRSTGQAVGSGSVSAAGPAGLGREVSNLMAAYTRDKPLQQQQVCLTGDKLAMPSMGRRQLTYLNPFSTYRQKQPWAILQPENTPASYTSRQHLQLPTRGGGAPFSLSANGQQARRDLVLSGSTFHNTDKVPLQPIPQSNSPHKFNSKLGAAHDSLMLLSRSGAPTILEKNLSFDQEVRLERCRRERSFAAVSETNVLATAHYVAYDSQPTRGEINLMKAREANKSRDGPRLTLKRNGLHRSMGVLPPFGQGHSHFILGRILDDSPRSVQPHVGDSGVITSSREGRDRTARTWDITARTGESSARTGDMPHGVGVHPQEDAIFEHPGEGEEVQSPDEERRSVVLDSWLQKDKVVVLPGEGVDDADDSVEDYPRPLSDTAATETVHIRNELTPMSAENRARLLPRDESHLETLHSERELTSRRQHRDVFVDHVLPSSNDINNIQQLSTDDSGAETITKNILDNQEIHSFEQGSRPSGLHHNLTDRENDIVVDSMNSECKEESVMDKLKSSQSNDPAFTVIRPGSGASETRLENHQSAGANGMELVSVDSSAPSYGALDSVRGVTSNGLSEKALRNDSVEHTDDTNSRNEAVEVNRRTADVATEPITFSDQEGDSQDNEPTNKKLHQQEPTLESTALQNGIHEDNYTGREDTLPDVPIENQSTDSAGKDETPPTESEQPGVSNLSRTVPASRESSSSNGSQSSRKHEDKIKDAVEGIAPPAASSDSSSQSPKPEPNETSSETKDAESKSLDEEAHGQKSEEELTHQHNADDSSAPVPVVLREDGKHGAPPEEDSKDGVEAIVTVTMDKGQGGDNFDGSKTFLTTTNVESDEWKNVVKV